MRIPALPYRSLPAVLALALLPAAAPAGGTDDGATAPPGLVLVKGGNTHIGTDSKEVETLIEENENFSHVLPAETPETTVRVEDFYLMPTEVTNEQYSVYVRIAGKKPPYTWGDPKALDEARRKFLEDESKRREEARAKGIPYKSRKFDAESWWDDNWKDHQWAVPDKLADHPATFVDYESAEGYARWAGLRLPTEAEWVRAARGDSRDVYPWGDDAATVELANTVQQQEYSDTRPVGSFPKGARGPFFDLAGNVWEWTSSPFSALKGYKQLSVKTGKGKQARTIDTLVSFDPSNRIVKGGSYVNPVLACRVSTRWGTQTSQSTAGIGFRCAASVRPGVDGMTAALDTMVHMSSMPEGVTFMPEQAFGLQHWTDEQGKAGQRIPDYRVITGYERMLCTSTEKIEANSAKSLLDLSQKSGPIMFCLLVLSKPTLEPALDAGAYAVAYRPAGKLPKPEAADKDKEKPVEHMRLQQEGDAAAAPAWSQVPGFDPDKSQFIFYDGKGEPLVAVEAQDPTYDRMADGAASIVPWVPPKRVDKNQPPPVPVDTLRFRVMTESKSPRKGFAFTVDLKLAQGSIDTSWR